jgi:hypothetical protein
VKLREQPDGNRAAEVVVAEVRVDPSSPFPAVYWDHDRSMPEGPNALILSLGGTGADKYVLEVESDEVGAFIGAMNLPDVAPVMASFLAEAKPEVIGAVVGHIITHLARARRERTG